MHGLRALTGGSFLPQALDDKNAEPCSSAFLY